MARTPWLLLLGLFSATALLENAENTKIREQLPYKGSVRIKTCPENEYFSEGKCCQKCAAGTHVSGHCTTNHGFPFCEPCTDGEDFTEAPNGLDECLTCSACRADDQIQVAECTRVVNAKCQCKEGTFCIPRDTCHLFCATCRSCGEDQLEKFPCAPTSDTVCADNPVTNSTTGPIHYGKNQGLSTTSVVLLSVLVGFILCIGALVYFICHFKRNKERNKLQNEENQLLDSKSAASALRPSNRDVHNLLQTEKDSESYSEATEETKPVPKENPCREEDVSSVRGAGPAEESSCPDSRHGCDDAQCEELLAEMDDKGWPHIFTCLKEIILPSRWKELMRLLGLAEVDIEAISLDYRNDVLEQNYQMLLAWRRHEGRRATLDPICDALDYMNLSGYRLRIEDALKHKGRAGSRFT